MTTILPPGTQVIVRKAFPPGHVRTPYFCRGKTGVIDHHLGTYKDPEHLAYGEKDAPRKNLYRVLFNQTDLWDDYHGNPNDTLIADIYENWLEPKDS